MRWINVYGFNKFWVEVLFIVYELGVELKGNQISIVFELIVQVSYFKFNFLWLLVDS